MRQVSKEIVRDVFLGLRRFGEPRDRSQRPQRPGSTGDDGILERIRYSERPERFEYRLTAKGRELNIA